MLTLDQIEAEALKLTPEERELLIYRLRDWDGEGDDEISSNEIATVWDEEIARRIEEIDSGKVKCIPYEEVMAEMKALLVRDTGIPS